MTPNDKAEYLVKISNENKPFENASQVFEAKRIARLIISEIVKSWEDDGNKRLDKSIIEYWQEVDKFLL